MKVSAYGERAVFVDLGIDDAPDRAAKTHAVANALALSFPHADVVVGGGCIAIVGVDPEAAIRAIDSARLEQTVAPPRERREHVLAAVYDGPDLEEVASRAKMSVNEVIALHSAPQYVVELVGFLPGFAYLGPIDPRLVLPRRASPRARVAAGSIGIAGELTGVYPLASPGGWNLIGRALADDLFSPERDPPGLFAPGDAVRFMPVPAPVAVATEHAPALIRRANAPAIVIVSAPAGATVQDGGRPGRLARGLPCSGPLDPVAHAAANRAVGNVDDAASIEIPLGAAEIEASGELVVSLDGEPALRLASGDRLSIAACARAVRYLAVAGGIDVPVVLGARATLVPARLGGFEGRPIRRGDVIPIAVGARLASARIDRPLTLPTAPLVVDANRGPHADRLGTRALDVLAAGVFRVSTLGDRVGVRLEGARVPRDGGDLGLPAPMLRGAVQIATDGTPIVLGPDHPTTGGYPVAAVVRVASQAQLARLRPGAEVRFRISD